MKKIIFLIAVSIATISFVSCTTSTVTTCSKINYKKSYENSYKKAYKAYKKSPKVWCSKGAFNEL